MEYELYTVPRCDECSSVKQFFDSKGIRYNVYNLREQTIEQKKDFGKICSYFGSKIKREGVHNHAIVPLLVRKKDNKLEDFAQGFEDIKKLFN